MLVIVFLFQLQYFIFVVNKKESISFNELIKKKKKFRIVHAIKYSLSFAKSITKNCHRMN